MLFEILNNARGKLYFIAKEIGVTDADRQDIEEKHPSDKSGRMHEMLTVQIRKGKLTLTLLCKSLRSKNVGRDDLAREIEGLNLQ